MESLQALKNELKRNANQGKALFLMRYFKTGPGEYGEGDIFLGLTVPVIRKIAKKYYNLELETVESLLHSKFHEERLAAIFILVYSFEKSKEEMKRKSFNIYLKNTKYINNWDLVDLSAGRIIGQYLQGKSKKILYKLAKSKNIWERRIAIMATFAFIKNNNFKETLTIAEKLLSDKHDLIHKAVGWMLREIGKGNLKIEENFLKKYYKRMPRTMLRYAIEKFAERKRKLYLKGKI